MRVGVNVGEQSFINNKGIEFGSLSGTRHYFIVRAGVGVTVWDQSLNNNKGWDRGHSRGPVTY